MKRMLLVIAILNVLLVNSSFALSDETKSAEVLPIARYSIDKSGVNGMVIGARVVGLFTGITLAESFKKLITGTIKKQFKKFTIKTILRATYGKQSDACYMTLCFPLHKEGAVSAADIISVLEPYKKLPIGEPVTITYLPTDEASVVQLTKYKSKKIAEDFIPIRKTSHNIGSSKWAPDRLTTMGVVNGYLQMPDNGRIFLIMHSYDAGIFLSSSPEMNFIAIDTTPLSNFPEPGSVIEVRGSSHKLSKEEGPIKQEYGWWHSHKNNMFLVPEYSKDPRPKDGALRAPPEGAFTATPKRVAGAIIPTSERFRI